MAMSKITENAIETFCIERLEKQGYEYIYAPDIAPDSDVFGNYIDVYDIAQAVEDGATVRIYYESRLAKVNLSVEDKQLVANLDQGLDDELAQGDLSETQKAKAKWTQLEALIGSEKRIKNIAQDIVSHFEQRQAVFEGKGMIVAMSRRIAADLYAEIIRIKPDWHSDDLDKGVIKVVMTSSSSDGPEIANHHTTKAQRKTLADRSKKQISDGNAGECDQEIS